MAGLAQEQQRKVTLILISIVAAIIFGVVVYQVVRSIRYSANLNLSIAPQDAIITLNDKQITNQNQRVRPGEYVLRAEREGFFGQETSFSIGRGETVDVLMALLPEDGNFQWYHDNPRDAIIFDGVITHEQDEAMKRAYESDPLIALLPYSEDSHGLIYIIEASYNDGIKLLIRLNTCSITSAAIYKEQALEWVRTQGFNPDDYQIEYITLCGQSLSD